MHKAHFFCSGPFCNIVYLDHLSVSRVSLLRNIMYFVSTPHLWHEGGEGRIFWQVHTGPHQYSVHFAAVYLDSARYVLAQSLFSTQHRRISSFVSSSVALFALSVFYDLTRENLEGRQPLAKFRSIKLVTFFTFCKRRRFIMAFFLKAHCRKDQGILFSILQSHGVIKGTTYWTAANVADGLQALCTCTEVYNFCNSPLRMSLISRNLDGFVRCTHDVVFRLERIPSTTWRSPSYKPFHGLPPQSQLLGFHQGSSDFHRVLLQSFPS